MPTAARHAQVDLESTPYYHCMARCVRRAFLCGTDQYTGKNFDHRKPWLVGRLAFAANIFAIDVCAYAVMSNHFHTVLRVDADRAARWSDREVARRYGKLFRAVVKQARDLPAPAYAALVQEWRERLCSISWFMRVVNEYVARRANIEDDVTGRFWEGRFRSQALLDEAAVLTCMSYVDLNPVRAGIASSIEGSDFTSVKQRIVELAEASDNDAVPLAPFAAEKGRSSARAISMRFSDYLELLEWTGRLATKKSTGRLRGPPPGLLTEMRIDPGAWLASMRTGGLQRFSAVGNREAVVALAAVRGKRWLKGQRLARQMFRANG